MQNISIADYAVIAMFFAVMIGVGAYYSRKAKSSEQFFGNDRSVPWWLSGVSFYMNSFSALAFVMYSALAYKYGWVPVTVSWLSVPAVLLGAWFLAVRWRRAATGSPIDYIATRYTPRMCKFLAWLGLPMQFLDNSFKLLAIGTVVGVGLGFPLFWAICISGVIIVLYTFMGGLKAALMCDFIQFLVILAVVFALPPLCLGKLASLDGGAGMAHGFQVFFDRVPSGFFNFTSGMYDWMYMFIAFFLVFLTSSTNWPLIQRYASTKSEKDAKKMAYLVCVLLFVGPPLFFFPAMAAKVFLTTPIADDALNSVYAVLCREILPTGMIGMVIAAMFSATMSSLAGNFNAVAMVMTNEVYAKLDRNATAGRKMVAARIATVLTGAVVIALTFFMQYAQGAKDLFDLSNQAFSVFLPPISLPMIAGILFRRLSKRSGMVALIGGIGIGLIAFGMGAWYPFLRETIPMTWLTSLATIALLLIGTWLFPDKPEETVEVDAFFKKLTSSEDA